MPSFEYFRKFTLTSWLRKARRGRDSSPSSLLIRYNIHTPWKTTSTFQTNGKHHHFFVCIPILGHVLDHSVDKTHVLVTTVELIWLLLLNIFSFNFVSTSNKSLSITRFRRSYVNRTAVVLTNHCQSYTAFLFDVCCSKWSHSFFCSSLPAMIVHLDKLFLLSTRVAWMLLISRWVSRRKYVKKLFINISKLKLSVKHSISCRPTFFRIPISRRGNFGMFVHSTTLISQFSHFTS